MKTIQQLLTSAKDISDTRENTIILSHLLNKNKEYIIAHPEKKISNLISNKFSRLLKKRISGLPIAYIIGKKEFYGLNFIVNKNVLIPRPDTELMVEKAIEEGKRLKGKSKNNIILIDIGTGSGCIPISIVKKLGQKKFFQVFATDISTKALSVAKKNAKKHKVRINFLPSNLLTLLKNKLINKLTNKQISKIIITANLPYLTRKQFQTEPSIQHEPYSALVVNKKGLALYEELFKQIKKFLKLTINNKQLTIYIEIDPSQTERAKKMIKEFFPKSNTEVYQDLSGLNRLIKIILP